MTAEVAQRLRDAAAELRGERIRLVRLLRAHGPAADGSLVLLLAVPCVLPIPGTGTVLGLGLIALAVSMWRGDGAGLLPRRVALLRMSAPWARRVLTLLAGIYAVAGRISRERLGELVLPPSSRMLAAAVGAMALVLLLPIPFGNVLPAIALVLIGLGLVFRDGLVLALGLLCAAGTAALMTALFALAADWSLDGLARLAA